jgi:hypothetical protein
MAAKTKSTTTNPKATATTAAEPKESTAIYSVQALPHVPGRWPGYRFRKIEHKGLKDDLYVRPERLRPVFLNRLPVAIQADFGKRVRIREFTPEEFKRERGQITEVPTAIPCVGDPAEE